MSREEENVEHPVYDLVIVGGGINGAGIARDAAGRGLRVLLCEKNDLGGGTSSASTKLIHGGLRYLEHREFRLVREALKERRTLLKIAPHIVWPLPFALPHAAGMRPAWQIKLGLWLYDLLAMHSLKKSAILELNESDIGAFLKPEFTRAFTYMDCWGQDSRLVVLNAMDAASRGAIICPRTECRSARRVDSLWDIQLYDRYHEQTYQVSAKALVNAAGPLAKELHDRSGGKKTSRQLRLVKGSHIVVPKLFNHHHAYLLQQPDKRIVFAIPYENDFTLIGTTEVPVSVENLGNIKITEEETRYLCDAVNLYFNRKTTPEHIVWSYSGVRPLVDDGDKPMSAVSREYVLEVDGGKKQPPMLSVFGGKLTTYRALAEQAMEKLSPYLPMQKEPWTAEQPLPGGDLPCDMRSWFKTLQRRYAWVPEALLWRYMRNYGTLLEHILHGFTSLDELGQDFGGGLYEAELAYLYDKEWARTPEDILWRRTKLGLTVPKGTETRILVWLAGKKSY